MTGNIDRRSVLRRTGGLVAVGSLAGCGGDGGGGGGEDGGDGGEPTPTPSPTPQLAESSEEVQSYVSDSENYDGQTLVVTGQDEVPVAVGAEGNGGAFAFGPPAIKISTGTSVVWEWTGDGGQHNVVHEEEQFRSGDPVDSEEETFEYSFEESGTYLYYCTPHKGIGMKGAVVVE